MTPIVCVVGKISHLGKTQVVERLVAELKRRGYRIAAVKHSRHGFDMDREGKDTWRFSAAGADAVMISSPDRVALIKKTDHDSSLGELARTLGPDFDLIIAEGFKREKAMKIEVLNSGQEADLACGRNELLAVVSKGPLEQDLPRFDPDDLEGLADLIEKRYLTRSGEDRISLFVNNQPVPLNEFVRSIFSNTLFGMVSSLKRIPQAKGIDISIRKAK